MGYSLVELSKRAAVPQSKIRYWVKKGVMPSTTPRGPNTVYDELHLLYALAAKRMSGEGSLI
jgi:DNA-binding transcriptional MerR regulator